MSIGTNVLDPVPTGAPMQVSTTPKWKMPSGLKFGLMLMYSPTSVLSQTNKSYDLLVQPCGRLVHNGCIRPKLGG